jgi:hypothetical protein
MSLSACGINYQEATATISEAEQAIAVAFEAVLDAEQTGANVSSLLVRLNDEAELLSAARIAFEDGDHDEAARLSGLSSEVGTQVESDALILKDDARNAAANRYRLYLAISAVAMITVILATFLGYRFLRKRHFEHLLKMKPEVKET